MTFCWTYDWPPVGTNMPSHQEILHNRTFQHSGKPSTWVDMECVYIYWVYKCQLQKQAFNRAHSVRELDDLQSSQEVFSPTADQYIPGTILEKATAPHSYAIEAQGKRYCRTRDHQAHPLKHPSPCNTMSAANHIPYP